MEQYVFSVTEVNRLLKELLDNVPQLNRIYIRGELSNYKVYPSGHHYFTLKDQECAIRCVMFKSQAVRLRFRPENGMKVVALGQVSVYPRDGAYQLYCEALTPDGVGDLHVAFEQLKEKLWREGLFAGEHKKPLPKYPRTIAIVTSPAGAAVHDMIRILRRRYPIAKVVLLPVRVQGAEAPAEIAGAIRYANEHRLADLLITGRGGGSLEDLWAFNDEQVARAIYDSQLPVISAVGHEPDVTIADYVADVRAATPSHAAELAVPDQTELMQQLLTLRTGLLRAEGKRLELLGERLNAVAGKRVITDPMAFIREKQQTLDYLQRELKNAHSSALQGPRQRLVHLSAALDAMSPLKVLGRGFAMVTDEKGQIMRSAAAVPLGSRIMTTLAEGRLYCRVEEKE